MMPQLVVQVLCPISSRVAFLVHEVELESACLSGRVRRPLYSFDSTQPLGCLGGSVVRASVLASSVSWVRIPPEQLFFLFGENRVVWVSCLPLFSIYRKEFSCDYSTWSVTSLVV